MRLKKQSLILECGNKQEKSYTSSLSTFNEYMTWAVFSLYVMENNPPHLVDRMISVQENFMETSRKFIHFKEFNQELIRLYEDQKIKTGSIEIESLYPPILNWMSQKE